MFHRGASTDERPMAHDDSNQDCYISSNPAVIARDNRSGKPQSLMCLSCVDPRVVFPRDVLDLRPNHGGSNGR